MIYDLDIIVFTDDLRELLNNKKVLLLAKRQYTGLKDKNGKEIYEGDIVSCDQIQGYDWKVIGVVHMGVDENNLPAYDFRAWIDETKMKDWKKGNLGGKYVPFHNNPEVIGNIYQDSHLLDE